MLIRDDEQDVLLHRRSPPFVFYFDRIGLSLVQPVEWFSDPSKGVEQVLHSPEPREIVLDFDTPWEGLYCYYSAVFQDDDVYRMFTGVRDR